MSGVSRLTLPDEFIDLTSEKILFPPEPQYLYAQMLYMASAQAELKRLEAAGVVGAGRDPFGQGVSGDYPASLPDMTNVLADKVRGEAIFVTDELAPRKNGHTLRFNRPTFTDTTYTIASRTVGSNDSITTTPVNLSDEQASITILRMVGPYDSTNSRPAPIAIDRLDSEHSVHSLVGRVGLELYRDRTKFLDTAVRTQFFPTTPNVIVFPGDPTFAITADTDAFATANGNGDRPMDAETLFRAEQKLADNKVRRFANGKYMCVLTPQQVRQIRTDPQFQDMSKFDMSLNPLRNSFVGMVGDVEIYVSQTNPTDTATVSGVTIHKGTVFGPMMTAYANAGPCVVRFAHEDNYGETGKVVWIAYEGFTCLDSRFSVEMHSN